MPLLMIVSQIQDLEARMRAYEEAYSFPSAGWYAAYANRDRMEGIVWDQPLVEWADTYRGWLMGLVAYRMAVTSHDGDTNRPD